MLLVALGCLLLACIGRLRASGPDRPVVDEPPQPGSDMRTLGERELPGEPPPVSPEFDLTFEVPAGVGGNALIIYVSERHGYYVETFQILINKKGFPFALELYYDRFLRANDVLVIRENIVPAELPHFGGDMGTGDDWEGVATRHGRYRAEDPDPLPVLPPLPGG